jgi:hypothetical protein
MVWDFVFVSEIEMELGLLNELESEDGEERDLEEGRQSRTASQGWK